MIELGQRMEVNCLKEGGGKCRSDPAIKFLTVETTRLNLFKNHVAPRAGGYYKTWFTSHVLFVLRLGLIPRHQTGGVAHVQSNLLFETPWERPAMLLRGVDEHSAVDCLFLRDSGSSSLEK